MKNVCLILTSILFIGCVSKPKLPDSPPKEPGERESPIDYIGLQKSLGMSRNENDLGYSERAFDSCKVGNGFSTDENCRKYTFVVINYQLECRDVDDDTAYDQITKLDIKPIAKTSIKWTLSGQMGASKTDELGFGQMRAVFPRSQKNQRIKLNSGRQFLYVKAVELGRIVTPQRWCTHINKREEDSI